MPMITNKNKRKPNSLHSVNASSIIAQASWYSK